MWFPRQISDAGVIEQPAREGNVAHGGGEFRHPQNYATIGRKILNQRIDFPLKLRDVAVLPVGVEKRDTRAGQVGVGDLERQGGPSRLAGEVRLPQTKNQIGVDFPRMGEGSGQRAQFHQR